jgi:ABC-type Mn2+/Zn2+ transport system permease subunit
VLELLTEPFAYGFMRTALAAGILTVVASSLIGTWVVLRGMAFMGDALAHGVLPGIAIAFLLGGNLMVGGALSAAVMIGGVSLASARSRLGEDTSIGLLFVGMLAAGVAIISKRGAYSGDLTTILFGDPIGVTRGDLRVVAAAVVVTLVATIVLYRPFLVLSFSRAKARVLGLRPGVTHVAMLALIALVVVTSFRTVGTLLVFAFLVAPPATASLVSRRVPVMMVTAMLLGSLAVVVGLLISFHLATATAATIAGLTVLMFFLVLAWQEAHSRLRTFRRQRAATAAVTALQGGQVRAAPDRWSGALPAGAQQLEAVGLHLEVALLPGVARGGAQRLLHRLGEGDVLDVAAHRAHEVVVVLRELLVELVACHVVGGDQPPHRPGLLEDRQVAVQRALGLARAGVDEVGDRHRPARLDQQVDELAAPQRVALARAAQLVRDRGVDVRRHGSDCRGRSRNRRESVPENRVPDTAAGSLPARHSGPAGSGGARARHGACADA